MHFKSLKLLIPKAILNWGVANARNFSPGDTILKRSGVGVAYAASVLNSWG